jgi:hypothetical protein
MAMSFMSNREYSLTGIEQAVHRARKGYLNCAELEDEQKVIKALVIDTIRAIRQLVDTATEDYEDKDSLSYLDGVENAVNDDVDRQFGDAIDKRDVDSADRLVSRKAPYGVAYDSARGA